MTVAKDYPVQSFQGNGIVGKFATNITLEDDNELRVVLIEGSTKERAILQIGTHYTISNAQFGATITLVQDAAIDIAGRRVEFTERTTNFLSAVYALQVRRVVAIEQQTSIKNQGEFYAQIHEDAFDKTAQIDQQQQYDLDSSIKVVDSNGNASGGTIEKQPDSLIGFDEEGNLKSEPLGSGGSIVVDEKLQSEINKLDTKINLVETRAEQNTDDIRTVSGTANSADIQAKKNLETLGNHQGDIQGNKMAIGDPGDDASDTGSLYARTKENSEEISDNQTQIRENTGNIEGTGDKDVIQDGSGDVTADNRGLLNRVGVYSDPAQDDVNGSLHARMNAERESRLDAVRGIEVGTNQYKGRGLRQFSDLHDENAHDIEVNRGKISKEVQRLDEPKTGTKTKSHAFAETIMNNSGELSELPDANNNDFYFPVAENITSGALAYQNLNRLYEIGEDTANPANAGSYFRLYRVPSASDIGSIGRYLKYSIFSEGISQVTRMRFPEFIGEDQLADSERNENVSYSQFNTYWETTSPPSRQVLEWDIEGRRVKGAINVYVPYSNDNPLFVIILLADTTYDNLDFRVRNGSSWRDVFSMPRQLERDSELILEDGSTVQTVTYFGQVSNTTESPNAVRDTLASIFESGSKVQPATASERSSISGDFAAGTALAYFSIGAVSNFGLGIRVQQERATGLVQATRRISSGNMKKALGGGGGGGVSQAKVTQDIDAHNKSNSAHQDIRGDLTNSENRVTTRLNNLQTAFVNAVGNSSQDPGFSGTLYQRIAQARKTGGGGGGTITKGYTNEFIIAKSTTNPVSNTSFPVTFTEDQWEKMKNASIIVIAWARTATQSDDRDLQTIIRQPFISIAFSAIGDSNLGGLTGPGGAVALRINNNQRRFNNLYGTNQRGSLSGLLAPANNGIRFVQYVQIFTETFTIT